MSGSTLRLYNCTATPHWRYPSMALSVAGVNGCKAQLGPLTSSDNGSKINGYGIAVSLFRKSCAAFLLPLPPLKSIESHR
jgi:hypothetical protein